MMSLCVCAQKWTRKSNLRTTAGSGCVCVRESLCIVYMYACVCVTLVDCAVSVLSVGRWRE